MSLPNLLIFGRLILMKNNQLRMEEINHPEPSREEIYAAQEDAWFHHLTDQFPTPLTEGN